MRHVLAIATMLAISAGSASQAQDTQPSPAAPPTSPEAPAPAQEGVQFTLDTSIEALLADPRAKAVLEAHVPMLLTHPDLPRAQRMPLRFLQRASDGRITEETMKAMERELAAIR
ncbi:hypothetical protein [Brevundimonas sp. FT23042]|uniref:hypothetical protein n=1 Tax=Brevundimonas sp. FT23042 TaxID=3393749 RepID=UPI003B588AB5